MSQLPLVSLILVNERTGERFFPCGSADWSVALDRWRADRQRIEDHPLLARLRARQRRQRETSGRESWKLYTATQRALRLRGLPCPMPEGHCMFEDPTAYALTRFD